MFSILKAYLPLWVVRVVQRTARPIVNIYVSSVRPEGKDEAYSVQVIFAVCFIVPIVSG